jgi:hypothetical protein
LVFAPVAVTSATASPRLIKAPANAIDAGPGLDGRGLPGQHGLINQDFAVYECARPREPGRPATT